jgi:hypothetical protein
MRIRSIKPSIHTDEDLWDLEQETGLPIFRAFTGLWAAADREGRFEWRPRALKAAILPYWDGDFSRVLDALSTRGFVVRYASQGKEIGLVRTFTRHQVVNNREQASVLPPPPESPTDPPTPTREPRVDDASPTPLSLARGEQEYGREQEQEQEREQGVAHASRSNLLLGLDLMRAINPKAEWPHSKWLGDLEDLGAKPDAEKARAITAILASEFHRTNPHAATPGHLVKYWPKYASGSDAIRPVANGKAPPPGAAEAVTKLGDQLKQLKTARRELDKSDPDYMSKIYDSDRDISQTQERLDRMRRKLEGAA